MENRKYIVLKDLEVYQLARQLSRIGWDIFESLTWQDKKIMGDQFIESTDSIGANIAEGYYRFHYLDKVKFYYYSRGSLAECSTHWLELLFERGKIQQSVFDEFVRESKRLEIKLNNFITVTYNQSQKPKK
ncbi:MAG: four helix bundle protein [Bacteroidales bacterium]|nr:four helix bundle protein [Bacteroidales bacterium]MCF8454837.1 four helix bundle protein [Bacteroidales bacterium]